MRSQRGVESRGPFAVDFARLCERRDDRLKSLLDEAAGRRAREAETCKKLSNIAGTYLVRVRRLADRKGKAVIMFVAQRDGNEIVERCEAR